MSRSLHILLRSKSAGETRKEYDFKYSALKRRLQLGSAEWIQEFLEVDGIGVLLESFRQICEKGDVKKRLPDTYLQLECIWCIKAVMNSEAGIDFIIDNADCVQKLATGLDTEDVKVKKPIFELLSAMCIYSADGYKRALEAIEHYTNCI
ncbi:inverted formin-2-like [Saccoglossus kowalevskii]